MAGRLSKYNREQMAKALVRHRFGERAAELCAESSALFNAVLDERYDAATQKLMRQLERRHPGALASVNRLYVRARGLRIYVGAARIGSYDEGRWTPETPSRPILQKEDTEPSDALADRISSFALAQEAFSEEVATAYRKALGTLGQFSSGKALEEKWPEAMPVIGHLIPTEDRSLPMVQLTAINDEFGLPPAEQAA